MKILVVMDAIGIGGISSAFLNYIKEVSQNNECEVLIFNDYDMPKELLPNRVKILKSSPILRMLGMPQVRIKRVSKICALLRLLFLGIAKVFNGEISRKILLSFQKKCISTEYDLAISYVQDVSWKSLARGCNDYVLNKVKSKYKGAFIHCDYKLYGGYHPKQLKMYSRFDYIFCVSKGCKNSFDSCFPVLSAKTVVSENFINVDEIMAKSCELKIDKKSRLNIVTVCRLSKEKGIQRALEVFAKLHSINNDFTWTIVGGGSEYDECIKMVKSLGLSKNVFFIGEKKNPFPYIAGSDVFLLPSFHEAAPMVFGECWALGIPIIATDTTSAKELVEERGIGVVCENSKQGLYNVLKMLFEKKLCLNDFENVNNNIRINENARKQLNYIMNIIKNDHNFKEKKREKNGK